MIRRYERQVMKKLWSEQHKFDTFLRVELACSYAWNQLGLFSDDVLSNLNRASYQLKDINHFEKEVKHDVIAFTKAVSLSLGKESKWLHYGLTSTDVVDTAQSLILHDVNQVIKKDLLKMMHVLKKKAYQFKDTPIIGRTHGIHAEVTSFGLKFALWYEDFKRLAKLFDETSDLVEVAKLSGAVGNYSANSPELENIAAQKLGLKTANIATQTLQRDRHAHYVSVIALIGAELEKMAVEVRHLSRTEIMEVSEYFEISQKGSSAMPHKKNPISSENITGLSRVLKGYMVSSYENISLWHERDISHSSVERIILPDATTLIDYMLNRFTNTLDTLVVHEEQMLLNINLTHGVIYAQNVLHQLIDHGMERQKGYDIIQKLSALALKEKRSFEDLLIDDKEISLILNQDEIHEAFEIAKHLKYVNHIYQKVFQ